MLRYTSLLFTLLLLFSCTQKTVVIEDNSQVGDTNYNESELNNADAINPKEIKSGIIYMKSTKPIHGSDIERTIYFDDYGTKRRVETVTVIEAAGQRVTTTQVTLDIDGHSYSFNPEKKTGYITKISRNANPTQLDFSKIDANTMQEFGIEEQGTEIIAGKLCTIYSINYEAMNFNGLYSIWNNIPLREISRTLDFGYEYVAYKVEDNVTVSNTYFTIPTDIDFQESSGMQLP